MVLTVFRVNVWRVVMCTACPHTNLVLITCVTILCLVGFSEGWYEWAEPIVNPTCVRGGGKDMKLESSGEQVNAIPSNIP